MKPVVLAPMAGVTDKPFRTMMRQFGNQFLYTEMVGVESLHRNHPVTRKMMTIQDEKNIIVQLVGINPDAMVYAAKMAQDNGAIGIDINMGCPVKKLISNGSGSALLKTPDTAAKLVETIKKAVSIPVSVKMRIGWDEKHINAVSFAKTLEQAGVNQITVHARTKNQGYSGIPYYDVVRQVKQTVSVPVLVNGDIINRETAEHALTVTGADGVLIGRGALGKPWILSDIETGKTTSVNRANLACQHLDLLLDYYRPHGVYVARKHIAWYAKGQKNVADFCQKVYAETNTNKIKKMIHLFFREGS
ncbi:MAG: tRNA dihydrouridine synthase DusB [Alphaproteobacteria bacterium]|nr:tRNA dihydrouridine synthase DusB [Alphaproteobacteria bacterium]